MSRKYNRVKNNLANHPRPRAAEVNKAHMAETIQDWPLMGGDAQNEPKPRGIQVYNAAELLGASGRIKNGTIIPVSHEMPMFFLTISERVDIARLCSPVFAVIQGRCSRVAGMEWVITKSSKEEDRIVDQLRMAKNLYLEYVGERGPTAMGIRLKCMAFIKARLVEVKNDLSNFEPCLLRWSKTIKHAQEDRCTEIEEWLRHPNEEDSLEDFTKKMTFDLHVHGVTAPFKQVMDGRIENMYVLPGGTVYPVKGTFVGQSTGYIQLVDNFSPQVMFKDELSFLRYAPRSDSSYGSVPLEALVNKVAESLMFDQRAAEMADGTKAPDKLLAFGDHSPFGDIGKEFDLPMSKGEQKRVEQVVNEYRKEALRVISGYGTPVVVDISRADTFGAQSERQRMVREEVGLVFGASNIEMNLTGADGTSGRATSESQERYDLYKGIYPIVQTIENFFNQDILPFRYGPGYEFEYKTGLSERERIETLTAKKNSGLYSTNEIRTQDLGEDPFPGKQYDEPQQATAAPAGAALSAGMGVL